MGWFSRRHTKGEPVNPFSVYKVLRELVGLMAAVRAEVRLLRKENDHRHREVMMAFTDLKTNVLQLIALAEAAATAAASAVASGGAASSADVDALNQSVVDALHILTPPVATVAAAVSTPAPPLAPVQPPSPAAAPAVAAAQAAAAAPAAPATPSAVDPNAPVTNTTA